MRLNTTIQLLLALLTFSAFVWVAWQGFSILQKEQLGLEANTQSILVIIAALAIICAFILSSAIRAGAQNIAHGQLLQRKNQQYEGFILVWYALLKDINPDERVKLEIEMEELKACIALQASQQVIQCLNQLQAIATTDGIPSLTTQTAFETLILAMRTDLGQTNYISFKKELNNLLLPVK